MKSWDCRELHSFPEFEQVVDLEQLIWGLNPRDSVPSNLLHAMAANGSLIAGAYDHDHMVGMSVSFPTLRDKRWVLWSHMTGSHPDYQGQGIGFALKQFQRHWALEKGFHRIGWTFDPLQRGNANFNLHLLGAVANVYHVNFYGDMDDAINAGLPSDRAEAWWDLRGKIVKKLADGKDTRSPYTGIVSESYFLRSHENSLVLQLSINSSLPFYLAEIPSNLASLKKSHNDLALKWRLGLREAFQFALSNAYTAVDFVNASGRLCYVFTKPQEWYLYVVRCSDDTLYTGITPDLSRRLDLHNSGRGASYTASRRPVQMIAAWQFPNRSQAIKAELALKSYSRTRKLLLVENYASFRDAPFTLPFSVDY